MKITVDITEEQVAFLKQFAANQKEGSKDNLATYKPMHFVQEKRYYTVPFHDDVADELGGTPVFRIKGYTEWMEDISECIRMYLEDARVQGWFHKERMEVPDVEPFNGSQTEDAFREYLEEYHADWAGYEIAIRLYHWNTVASFFILKNALAYKKQQAYKLTEPRTYTAAPGDANNGEYEPFWDFLMRAGTQLLEENMDLGKDDPVSEEKFLVVCYSVHEQKIASVNPFESKGEACNFIRKDAENTFHEENISSTDGKVELEVNDETASLSSCDGEYKWTWEVITVQ